MSKIPTFGWIIICIFGPLIGIVVFKHIKYIGILGEKIISLLCDFCIKLIRMWIKLLKTTTEWADSKSEILARNQNNPGNVTNQQVTTSVPSRPMTQNTPAITAPSNFNNQTLSNNMLLQTNSSPIAVTSQNNLTPAYNLQQLENIFKQPDIFRYPNGFQFPNLNKVGQIADVIKGVLPNFVMPAVTLTPGTPGTSRPFVKAKIYPYGAHVMFIYIPDGSYTVIQDYERIKDALMAAVSQSKQIDRFRFNHSTNPSSYTCFFTDGSETSFTFIPESKTYPIEYPT